MGEFRGLPPEMLQQMAESTVPIPEAPTEARADEFDTATTFTPPDQTTSEWDPEHAKNFVRAQCSEMFPALKIEEVQRAHTQLENEEPVTGAVELFMRTLKETKNLTLPPEEWKGILAEYLKNR